MKCVRGVVAFLLAVFSMPTLAEESGRELLDKARTVLATAPAIQRVDTTELSGVLILGEARIDLTPQKTVVAIDIEMPKQLARQTGMFKGQELVMLKQGEHAAMKLGKGPWEIPTGNFGRMAENLGSLFYCEIVAPETKENAPTWKVVGTELLDGEEAFVIENEPNTGLLLAQERMAKVFAKELPGNPAERTKRESPGVFRQALDQHFRLQTSAGGPTIEGEANACSSRRPAATS